MRPTRTEAEIIALLKEGCFLHASDSGAATITVRHLRRDKPIRKWTTRKTVRAMVAKGLLTREWSLPAEPEEQNPTARAEALSNRHERLNNRDGKVEGVDR